MLRDEYFRRLVDEAHIELYLSSNDGARVFWPWRMQPPKEARMSYRNACERYIIDSDPLDDNVTTEDVLDCAHKLDAEVASLQDVYQDKEATVDSLLKGLEIADDHAYDGQLLLPLQDPFVECYKELGEPSEHMIGIGGLKKAAPHRRIKTVKTFREEVGYDPWLHGFGWGLSGGLDSTIRQNPELLDSVDYSTPIQTAVNKVDLAGEERMSVQAMHAATRLVQDLRKVTPYPSNEDDEYLREDGQVGLDSIV
jgi:hypothetical protein